MTSDRIDDVARKLAGTGLRRDGFLLHDEAKSSTETMGELVGILVGDMHKVMLADGSNRGCFDCSGVGGSEVIFVGCILDRFVP